MKGKKGSTDEGGVRAPCMIRWPRGIKAGTKISQIAGAIDLLPTLADMAGIPIVGSKPLDGISVKPLLSGNAGTWPDRMIFTHQKGKLSVRTQQYRLDNSGALFDMTTDGGQEHDISGKKPETAAELRKAMEKFRREVLPKEDDDRPYPVGFDQGAGTMLPARDGKEFGGIRRSAKAPNCSYFKNWTNTQDKMTWDIEVGKTGEYSVEVYYTCPKKDVGSTVELSFNGNTSRGKVTKPNDPPLVGKSFDRFQRGSESYVKDFKPMSLNNIKLKKGRGILTLKAIDVPGAQVMEVRLIILKSVG